MNSSKLIQPSPSPSTSRIMLFSSSSLAGCPKLPIIDPSSEVEIFPSPLTSNFLNTSSSSPARHARVCTNSEVERDAVEDDDGFRLNRFIQIFLFVE
ncbi:unnamed protein product [Vicia faba]|uniref:Uncharacterized protein n=1 Tax=Vicia faba TaxID=3906 RepID=A0AAV1A448_VICFA|nr:unnamed protein product [Vicia faba]CAI8603197.1 unnamed protein product [Vicia faba]